MTCDLARPCTRCIKRDIGHLCHDEPRELSLKKVRIDQKSPTTTAGQLPSPESARNTSVQDPPLNTAITPRTENQQASEIPSTTINPGSPLEKPTFPAVSQVAEEREARPGSLEALDQQDSVLGYDYWTLNQFQDMHTFHPSYAFNAPEVTNEYNLLNSFINNSLLDENALELGDDGQLFLPESSISLSMIPSVPSSSTSARVTSSQQPQMMPTSSVAPSSAVPATGGVVTRPSSAAAVDKAQEYFMTAADPAGNDTAEQRMKNVLKAKYDAGLLKPFNYVKGYSRLDQYMAKNMQSSSRQRILRQLDKFRPKFRELMHSLTDMQLIYVEMWFERCLMESDRLFASMAIPACCWRRTGEIFRGNKEMAELINVPLEKLKDGKLAIHEIIVEDSIVSYWEKFGTIAFDSLQKAMLTSCYLKNPDPASKEPPIHCCFSFTIRRDSHKIPSLIIGNFLPTFPSTPNSRK